jgi:hypothetical protein
VFLSGAVSDGGVFPAVECFFPVLLFPVQIWFSSEVGKHLIRFRHGLLMGGFCLVVMEELRSFFFLLW